MGLVVIFGLANVVIHEGVVEELVIELYLKFWGVGGDIEELLPTLVLLVGGLKVVPDELIQGFFCLGSYSVPT